MFEVPVLLIYRDRWYNKEDQFQDTVIPLEFSEGIDFIVFAKVQFSEPHKNTDLVRLRLGLGS